MRKAYLNEFLKNGDWAGGLRVGLSLDAVANLQATYFEHSHDFGDGSSYFLETIDHLPLTLNFDKNNILFQIVLDLEDVERDAELAIMLMCGMDEVTVHSKMRFEELIAVLESLNHSWEFDRILTHGHHACIALNPCTRMTYSFEGELSESTGLYTIRSVLPGHHLLPRGPQLQVDDR